MPLPSENVEDYPRPPASQPAGVRVEVHLAGHRIASSDRALRVLETFHAPTYYVPLADVADGALRPAGGGSICEWKGRAAYFDVVAGGQVAPRAAWSYPAPAARFAAVAGHVAFYPAAMELCSVGGVAVVPQPGDFYGGWVTPNLTGRIKGAPGTRHW